MEFLLILILVATVAAFGICLFYKLGIIEYLQIHGNKLIASWAECEFCQSFWACVIGSMMILPFFEWHWYHLFIPIFASPVTRHLIQ